MLEFLIPILYLEKLARVTIIVGNMIFGAYTGERVVDWTLVIRDMVTRLLAGIGKPKPTSICPYLLHLYYVYDAIQPEDKKVYMVGEFFMQHNVKPDEEEQSADMDDPDHKSLSSGETAKLQAQQEKKKPSPPMCKLTLIGKMKERPLQEGGEPAAPRIRRGLFGIITDALQEI